MLGYSKHLGLDGAALSGDSCQEEIIQRKFPRAIVLGGFSWGQLSGDSFPRRNYSGVVVLVAKARKVIFLGGFHGGNYLGRSCPGGSYSGVVVLRAKFQRVVVLGEFDGG